MTVPQIISADSSYPHDWAIETLTSVDSTLKKIQDICFRHVYTIPGTHTMTDNPAGHALTYSRERLHEFIANPAFKNEQEITEFLCKFLESVSIDIASAPGMSASQLEEIADCCRFLQPRDAMYFFYYLTHANACFYGNKLQSPDDYSLAADGVDSLVLAGKIQRAYEIALSWDIIPHFNNFQLFRLVNQLNIMGKTAEAQKLTNIFAGIFYTSDTMKMPHLIN